MNGVSKDNSLEKTPLFHMDGGDLYYLAKKVYKLSFNKLSPFSGQPESGGKPGDATMSLAKDPELKSLSEILARPDVRITMRRGGSNVPLTASSAYIQKGRGNARVACLEEDRGGLSALLFDSIAGYAAYLAAQNASPVNAKPVNLIKTALPLETLVFIFALTDCYRRAYLNGMLAYSAEPVEAVCEDEYITTLEQELKSGDIRWLLPSLLRLVPGLNESTLEFTGQQVEFVENMNFISRAANPEEKRPIYLFASSGNFMGLEFALFWKQAAGLEVTALDNDTQKCESVGRYYFAPTDEANHFISLETSADGTRCTHHALTLNETEEYLKKCLEGHIAASHKGGSAQSAPVPPAGPAKNFCPECGAKTLPGAAFCGECGMRLK